jgi:hypothetical protein
MGWWGRNSSLALGPSIGNIRRQHHKRCISTAIGTLHDTTWITTRRHAYVICNNVIKDSRASMNTSPSFWTSAGSGTSLPWRHTAVHIKARLITKPRLYHDATYIKGRLVWLCVYERFHVEWRWLQVCCCLCKTWRKLVFMLKFVYVPVWRSWCKKCFLLATFRYRINATAFYYYSLFFSIWNVAACSVKKGKKTVS